MLQLIRDRAQGIVVWTIVGLVIVTFALFGLSSYLTGNAKTSVAEVNGTEITENQLLRAKQDYQQRMQQMLGEQYNPDMFDNDMIKQEVLQGLITREVIQQHIQDAGFQPAARQVVEYIRSFPAFQEAGQFSSERYKQVLRLQGIVPEQFERNVASDLAAEQIRSGITGTAFVTRSELERYARLKNQQRNIGYLVLELNGFLEQVNPTDEEISAYYAANKAQLMTPEKVSVKYLELDLQKLAQDYAVSDQTIRQYYESNRSNYVEQAEQRQARHILITIDAEQTETEARKLAEQLYQQITEGAVFAKLARQHSQDPGSAKQGGDLGFFGRGVMDPAFEQAAFSLEQGEISKPVKTPFGYHLIKIEKIRPEKLTPLSEVKDQIRTELQMRQAEQAFYEKIDDLNRYSYEMPDSLAGVADKLGLEVKQSPFFTRQGGNGIFNEAKVIQAAFSDEVLQQGRNSELIELSDTHMLVLRINEHQPARQKDLSDVRPRIVSFLKRQQAQQLAFTTAQQIESELRAGTQSGEQLARQYKAKWYRPGFIKRQPTAQSKLDNVIRREAFQMAKPADQQATATTTTLNNGDIAVLRLYAVRAGELETEPAKLKTDRVRLSTAFGNSDYNATLANLRRHADITINNPLKPEQ